MPTLVRAQSWPLINFPGQTQWGDVNRPCAEEQLEIPTPLDDDPCCRFACRRLTGRDRCCCEVRKQMILKKNESLLSRLLRFRTRTRKGGERHGCEADGGYAEGKSAGVPTAANGNPATVPMNGDRSAIVEDQEKKMVTSSPTFQQLIMTRRLLCRHYYPEGGWGVIIIIVAVLVQTLSHGLHLSFGILLLPASRRFHTRWYHTSKCEREDALQFRFFIWCPRSLNYFPSSHSTDQQWPDNPIMGSSPLQ